VATTRIETMLGDTGVAVNPKDSRYSVRERCGVECVVLANRAISFAYTLAPTKSSTSL